MTHPLVPHPTATRENRRHVITSTDARCIAAGEWSKIFNEKRGNAEREDLTFVWKARLGLATEKVHAWWHGHVTGNSLVPMGEQVYCNPQADLPAWVASSYDYWVEVDACPLELKHSHGRQTLRDAADFYMAQLQWEMMVAGASRLRFSIICGNEEPVWAYVEADADYQAKLLRQATQLWQMIQDDIPPEDTDGDAELAAIVPTIKVNGTRSYDWSTNNEWVAKAGAYLADKPAHDRFKAVDKELRALVPKDAGQLVGGGLTVKRDKAGKLRFSIDGEDD